MSREDMFNIIKQCEQKKVDEKLKFLQNKLFERTKCPEHKKHLVSESVKSFKHYYKLKWVDAGYKECRFRKNNEQWLKGTITLPAWTVPRSGRPAKDFKECSERTKRRKTEHLRSEMTHEELTFAASMSERAAGNTDLSSIIKDAAVTPTRATKYKKVIRSAQKVTKSVKLSPTEALAKLVEAGLTRNQYNIMRHGLEHIYPCYSIVQEEKKKCYPTDMIVTETTAEIKLQNLLDHITQRLCLYLQDVLINATECEKQNMELICKWGCDGSKQQEFKQKFTNSSDSDSHVFISSLVPLRLISIDVNGKHKVWWQNPVPSSPRFCSPIRMQYIHENNDVTKSEISHIETQAQNLNKTEVETGNAPIHVKHTLALTMVDGKVCNAATDTSSTMRCYICKQTSKSFNDLIEVDDSDIDPNSLRFGLSILHARIRFFESILHISYKLPFKKWRLNKDERKMADERKKHIQEEFKNQMGLLVDIPKAGFGNTNDGNTSRRFFEDPETSADITGVDIGLIKRFKLILEIISCGFPIKLEKFSKYLSSTAKYYVDLYAWHPMTPTIHKILAHGVLVIKNALLPIGQLSEEAAESRNKHFRLYRQNFARKFSRTQCNQDVLNRLLLTSDIFLSCSRVKLPSKRKPLSSEALEFLECEEIPNENVNVSVDDDVCDDVFDDDCDDFNLFYDDESE